MQESNDPEAEVRYYKIQTVSDSVGCNHHWENKPGNRVECINCTMGLYDVRAVDGKLVKPFV